MSFKNKNILLGVTGGIAAYKIHTLIRELVKEGANVQVLMTPDAHHFVTPLSLSTLSKRPVYTEFYNQEGTWNNHVNLALWADVFLIAPCTANTLGKMAHGIANNLLLATYFSAKCPVFIAPAMDLDMYAHPTTEANLKTIQSFGNKIIPAEEGELASGLVGKGRMAEPETIKKHLQAFFNQEINQALQGKKILITAGPTYELIDPVRFIGNFSSGKMGFALAQAAAESGAKVILISGPTDLQLNHPNISITRVKSAKEMLSTVMAFYDTVDIAIMSAAVADYAPKETAAQKIKKTTDEMQLTLVKNPDILYTMGTKKQRQFLVGFALETQNEEENAKKKLQKKNLDLIVLNSLRHPHAGFQKDTNQITIFGKNNFEKAFQPKNKNEVARDILAVIASQITN